MSLATVQLKYWAKVRYTSCTLRLQVSYRSGDGLSSSKEPYCKTDEPSTGSFAVLTSDYQFCSRSVS